MGEEIRIFEESELSLGMGDIIRAASKQNRKEIIDKHDENGWQLAQLLERFRNACRNKHSHLTFRIGGGHLRFYCGGCINWEDSSRAIVDVKPGQSVNVEFIDALCADWSPENVIRIIVLQWKEIIDRARATMTSG